MYEAHIYQAIATATVGAQSSLRPGDRHAMLAFLRQPAGTDHDWAAAEAGIIEAGWTDVSFERAGTLTPERLNGKSEDFIAAFETAMGGGCGLIIYSDPVTDEE